MQFLKNEHIDLIIKKETFMNKTKLLLAVLIAGMMFSAVQASEKTKMYHKMADKTVENDEEDPTTLWAFDYPETNLD